MKVDTSQSHTANGSWVCPESLLFLSRGIIHQCTVPYTPHQSGITERKNRTLMEMAGCMMKGNSLPRKFWLDAINYVLTISQTRALKTITPYKLYKTSFFSSFVKPEWVLVVKALPYVGGCVGSIFWVASDESIMAPCNSSYEVKRNQIKLNLFSITLPSPTPPQSLSLSAIFGPSPICPASFIALVLEDKLFLPFQPTKAYVLATPALSHHSGVH